MGTSRWVAAAGRWLIAAALLLLPCALYYDTIAAHYGLRDDYSIPREAREEPGKVLHWCASQGRPLYGVVLQASFARLDGTDDLRAVRAASALAVGLVALLARRALRRARWPEAPSLAFAALLAVLPAAQIDVSWAVCLPHVLAAVAGLAGFLAAEGGGALRRACGAGLVACGALLYQPHALFYIVPVAAGLVARRDEPLATRARWLSGHLAILAVGLALAFAIVTALFASGVFEKSTLWTFESDPWAKLRWFASQPLPNALALIVLRDTVRGASPVYWLVAAGMSAAIGVGVLGELRRGGLRSAGFFALAGGALVVGAFAANLIASERTPKYRTIWALSAVCVVFAVHGLEASREWFPRRGRLLAPAALALLALVGAPLARGQAYTLIARPQGQELALVERSVSPALLRGRPEVFVIRPSPEDAPAPLRYEDEFGSLSSDSDWVPIEMLKSVLQERAPSLCDAPRPCRIATGRVVPTGGRYDLVIDMHRLRELRSGLGAAGVGSRR